MLGWQSFFSALFASISFIRTQKLLVIIVEGLPGNRFHELSNLPGFRNFHENGVWSTLLYPQFPTLPLPNRQTIMTGLLSKNHGFVGDYLYNWRTQQIFYNFESTNDLSKDLWWKNEPIFITSQKAGAPTALFFFPECEVLWRPRVSICESPHPDRSSLDDMRNIYQIIEATQTNDLVMVNHVKIREIIEKQGMANFRTKVFPEITAFLKGLERLESEIRQRIDLNMIVISPHGYIDVTELNKHVIDNYISMDKINITIGAGAVKQIITNSGFTQEIYNQLRFVSPIPNAKIYYTIPQISDIPSWFVYEKSDHIPDLVLIATPGSAIYSENEDKQIPFPSRIRPVKSISGYNNEYPEMLGLFLAYGPIFQRGMRKGPINLVDIYALICDILHLPCLRNDGNSSNVEDILNESFYQNNNAAGRFNRLNFFCKYINIFANRCIFIIFILCCKNYFIIFSGY
ncbi:unnamed protein product [Dracunculus medinensis]|uniref:glycerophosphocholine cholinephosphodiesterase n=1 Tax=Dracunculus medinensis TaxID=318479 RepID=A0A0N4U3Y8_DRAME|nr:unnamed protein product [Dracunculus medinensis]